MSTVVMQRYQKELNLEKPSDGTQVLADPLKQRAHLLSISVRAQLHSNKQHKHPEVDELCAIGRYIIAKRADIRVEGDSCHSS